MYKVLLITLIVLSASVNADLKAETGDVQLKANSQPAPSATKAAKEKPVKAGTSASVDSKNAKPSPQPSQQKVSGRTGFNAQPSGKAISHRKCPNRYDISSRQVANNCVVCSKGQHELGGKCVSNQTGCAKGKFTDGVNCKKCKFWYWSTKSTLQGNYCYNRWWTWVIIFFSGFIGLLLIISLIGYFACCDDCCSKKQSKKSSKGKNGEVNVQSKKPDQKKKSSGCCGGDKKKKSLNPYDRGYAKPGFCDCMCCAGSCGGCCGSMGCTCSKCCDDKGMYVSGYSLSESNY